MSSASPLGLPIKTCFVTFGATAAFDQLLEATLAPTFLSALEAHSYTNLLISYGADGEAPYSALLSNAREHGWLHPLAGHALNVSGFGLDPEGLRKYMLLARGNEKGHAEGVVMCHAGRSSTPVKVSS